MDNKLPLSGPSFEPSKYPKKLVFLLHGYGDNADNFINIASELHNKDLDINFFVPNAPSSIPQYPTGKQWFDLYPNGINFDQAGPDEIKILEEDCLSSANLIKNYILNICNKFDLSFSDVFIIGFSQGAMMTFEVGKIIDSILAGAILLSGRILPSKKYKKELFAKTPLFISHGDQDLVLQPEYFFEACKILENEGYSYESHLLNNEGHNISKKAIHLVKNFIKKNV